MTEFINVKLEGFVIAKTNGYLIIVCKMLIYIFNIFFFREIISYALVEFPVVVVIV